MGGLYLSRRRRRRRWPFVVLALIATAALAAGVMVAIAGPDRRGALVVTYSVHSRLVGRDLRQQAVVPAGLGNGEKRPLLVFLHGRSGRPGDFYSTEFYKALAQLGERAPVVVEVSGGDHSYYHDRRGGRWGSYVMREALPAALKRLPVDPKRIAIGGISMGGFAALDLARLHPTRFCAAGGHSPAIWTSAGATAPGAFDSAADFARHDVVRTARTGRRPWGDVKLWIDRGDRDPFVPGDAALVRALRGRNRAIASHIWPGRHAGAYWRRHTEDYLRFYARALAGCRG